MKYSEFKKLLKDAGCYLQKEGGNHEHWYSPKTGKAFLLGRHNREEVATGTLNAVLKRAGLK